MDMHAGTRQCHARTASGHSVLYGGEGRARGATAYALRRGRLWSGACVLCVCARISRRVRERGFVVREREVSL